MANLFDLQQYKCKTCGEPLDIIKAQNGVIKCGVCDSVFTLPKDTATEKLLSFLTQGEHDLDTCKFDDAYAAYSKAAELDKTEPEAYFGMALSEFKIQYLKDEVNNRLQPICHEVTDKVFADSANFLKALRYATDEQRKEYERKAEEIEYIMTEFFKLKKSGLDYDCFICVKVRTDDGGRTEDYKAADDIYFELKGKGYKPFFSERELTGVTGADYEARILYALSVSECMLVICFDEGYLRTKWVKNEYTRFLKLVNDEEKESDSIALVFGKRPVEKLSEKRGKLQGISFYSLSAMERIVAFVEGHTPEAKRKAEEEAKRKSEESEALKKKFAEQEELLKKLMEQVNAATAATSVEPARKVREREHDGALRAAEEKARKEAESKAAEAARIDAEERAKQAAAKRAATLAKKKEEAEKARIDNVREQSAKDCVIEDGMLTEYNGDAAEVIIPYGVTEIDFDAFSGHENLKSIEIPETVIKINGESFSYCSGLESISVDPKNKEYHCSGNCLIETKTKTLVLGCKNSIIPSDGSVTVIGEGAFWGCVNLTNIQIPNMVTKIGENAFCGCGLTEIEIPESVTEIGFQAFSSNDLKSVKLPDGVKVIDSCLFSDCEKLTEVKLPDGITEIGYRVFENCKNLKAIKIPDTVKLIGFKAFDGCSNLTDVKLPDDVPELGNNIFKGCDKLPLNEYGGALYFGSKKKPYLMLVRAKSKDIATCTIHEQARFIFDNAFEDCEKLSEIVVPDGVIEVGDLAFAGCDNIASVILPRSLEVDGDNMFGGCVSLTNVILPDNLEEISDCTFYNCTSLKSITIPASVEYIDSGAFEGCESLESINFCGTKEQWEAIEKEDDWDKGAGKYAVNCLEIIDGVLQKCNGDSTNDYTYYTNIVIPETVTKIGDCAFADCRLTSIKIPDTVTEIGEGAFENCKDLKSITLPEAVTKIGDSTFSGCEKLKNINIPKGITVIGNYAFSGCSSLTDIILPDGLICICASVFEGCENLTGINIPDGVTYIGDNAFENCEKITEINIPDGVTYIGDCAFCGCGIENIVIPASVTKICDSAFEDCVNLKNVTIPSGITEIGIAAFDGCENLNYNEYGNGLYLGNEKNPYLVFFAVKADAVDLTLHKNTEIIVPGTLCACDDIENIAVESGNKKYHVAGNCIIETATKTLVGACTKSVIPTDGSVVKIGKYAFLQLNGLTELTIPECITEIESQAILDCSNLKCIIISDGTTSIDESAIDVCSIEKAVIPASAIEAIPHGRLKEVVITSGTKIEAEAFENCKNLTSITLADSITEIGEGAFAFCPIEKAAVHPVKITRENHKALLTPPMVTSMGIPKNKLKEVVITSGTEIAPYAFQDCGYLSTVTITGEIEEIRSSAFFDCVSLTSITIPASVTLICNGAFAKCTNLKTIYYNGTKKQWKAIVKEKYWDKGTGRYKVSFLK